MTSGNRAEIVAYESQAREFLGKSREFLAAGDLHQAAEKGWGAAECMAKAAALAQGWRYTDHSHFRRVMNLAGRATGNPRLRDLHGRAEILHVDVYVRNDELDAEEIGLNIEAMSELLDILYPLTGLGSGV